MQRIDASVEIGIIGSMLLDDKCIESVLRTVTAEDFTSASAKRIFEMIAEMAKDKKAVDILTVIDALDNDAGLKQYAVEALNVTPTAANVETYCQLLKAQSQRDKLAKMAQDIDGALFAGDDYEAVLTQAKTRLDNIERVSLAPLKSSDALMQWFSYYERVKNDPDSAYCATGYGDLDRALGGGLFNDEVYILAARPGMGKTTQAIDIAEKVTQRGRPVLFASLEMSAIQITSKRLANVSGMNYTRLLRGRLSGDDMSQVYQAADAVSNRPFFVVDSVYTVGDIERYALAINNLALIVVDYLGLIQTGERPVSRYEEITHISAELKALAKRLHKPILVLAQLNRENTTRSDKRPTMADLRDSGAIEQDAGAVILLHRESYYKPEEEAPQVETIELIIAKNRHAAPCTVKMLWNGESGRINEISDKDMPF